MKTRTLWYAAAWAALSLLSGCGGRIVYPRYYTLVMAPGPLVKPATARFNGTLAVRKFEMAPYLRQGGIAYREAPEEIAFYDYHRWAANPAETITSAVMESIRGSQLFSFVKRYDGQNQDYLMTGRVERLDEIDYGGQVRVQAKLTATLLNLRSGATLWTGDAAETLTVESRNINSVVTTMSEAVQKSIDRLLTSLNRQTSAN